MKNEKKNELLEGTARELARIVFELILGILGGLNPGKGSQGNLSQN